MLESRGAWWAGFLPQPQAAAAPGPAAPLGLQRGPLMGPPAPGEVGSHPPRGTSSLPAAEEQQTTSGLGLSRFCQCSCKTWVWARRHLIPLETRLRH